MANSSRGILVKKFSQADLTDSEKLSQASVKWTPALALFLFSDASMTRNLELIFASTMKIKLREDIEGISELSRIEKQYAEGVEGPYINRKITFMTEDGRMIMFAESIWNKEAYEGVMKNKESAIGKNMGSQKFESFREINFAGVVENDKEVNDLLTMTEQESLLIRNYYLWNKGKRACVIQEYFSKEVKKVLGLE